jgi:protein phosphatase
LLIEIPDPSLILLIGSSGAGKSTFAARHFMETEVVSSDRCRALICDDESDQNVNRAVFSLLHHIIRARSSSRRTTVVDATNLEFRSRRSLLRIAVQYRLPAVAIAFKLSLETCLRQNRSRLERQVYEEVLARHSRLFDEALRSLNSEGFDRIYLLDEMNVGDARVERVRDESSCG